MTTFQNNAKKREESFPDYLRDYREKGFTCFTFKMEPSVFNEGKQKHIKGKMHPPSKWQQSENFNHHCYQNDHNMLALRLDNFISIDIDNIQHWELFLQVHGHSLNEFDNVPQDRTPNKGIHYMFATNQNVQKSRMKFRITC